MQKQINLVELISFLGLSHTCLDWLRLDYHNALIGLRDFKKAVEKQRRILSKIYHPDKQGGDLEKMKAINEATNILLALRIQPPQRTVVIHMGSFHFWPPGGSTDSATTSTGCW